MAHGMKAAFSEASRKPPSTSYPAIQEGVAAHRAGRGKAAGIKSLLTQKFGSAENPGKGSGGGLKQKLTSQPRNPA